MLGEMKEKTWGGELWFANNGKYCGKLLWIEQGKWSSEGKYHYHKIKDETFFCIEGDLILQYVEDDIHRHIILRPNESFRILPGIKHRFSTKSFLGCKFIEASTTHSELDSYRCEWNFIDKKWVE